MLAEKEVAAPAPSINTDPIFVAIEMSRSKRVVGTHIPTSSKVGIHTVEWGDAAALLALVERLRSRAADVVGIADVPVLCLLRSRVRRLLALPPARRRRAPCLGDRPFQPAGQPTRQAREDGSDRREGDDPCADGLQLGRGPGAQRRQRSQRGAGGPPSARSGTTELGLRLHRAYQPHSGTAADTRDRRLRPARQRR
jgi:hypothetical protein